MRIGLDFDGTIAIYDRVFHQCAVEQFGLPSEISPSKSAIRDWFWATPAGKEEWIELQAQVYGVRIREACIAPGLEEFLQLCWQRKIHVAIISHKTEFPARGPRINLREAAHDWLQAQGFYDRMNVAQQDVFFEPTRAEKIRRIISFACSRFVDDLEEVFLEPAFPMTVEKLLYSATKTREPREDIRVFPSWDAIRHYFLQSE